MATINLKSFPAPDDVACPGCQHLIILYDPQGSEYCVCSSCNSLIRFTANDTPVIQKQAPVVKKQPVLKLGSTGVFDGHSFIVIAYIEKKEKDADYAWREYLLYNYENGYASFAEYDGHWTFVAGKEFYPELEKLSNRTRDLIDYQEQEYRLFNKYTAITTGLIGELDWDLLAEKAKTSEFVAPPYIIYKEQDKPGTKNADFYLGRYAQPAEVAEAFKISIDQFPEKDGIGANEPSKYTQKWRSASKIAPILIILVGIIGLVSLSINPQYLAMDRDYSIVNDSTKANEFKPFITPSFELKNATSALDFLIRSDIDNNWLEATVVLVNEKDNRSWEVTKSIEYYHGYEDGENWTEGSQDAEVLLSAIPQGRYHLNIYPASGDINHKTIHISINVNPVIWRNVWVTILLLCIYPFYIWLMMRTYEKKRWMTSDYSPYGPDGE